MTALEWLVFCTVWLAMLAAGRPAFAHPMNVAYANIDVAGDGVHAMLSMNLFEVDLLLGLDTDKDARVDQQEVDRSASAVIGYLNRQLTVTADDEPLPMTVEALRVTAGADGKDLLVASLHFPARHTGRLTIRCEPLTELGPDHRTLAKISIDRHVEQFVFEKGAIYHARQRSIVEALGQFVQLGVVHIFTGYDHLLFLLGLLLATSSLLDAVKVVTAFTVAHSVTLTLAVLGVVTPPNRVVEAGIALSIVYVAIENLAFGKRGRRWLVSLSFGLVHGFGFANVLQEMDLARSSLVSSLLSFNVGVELGQVAVVLLLLPLLAWLRRDRHFPAVLFVASGLILMQGLWWFYERALK